jgi:hypothetical protein
MARFGILSLGIVALLALVMSVVWSDVRSREALYASAGLAFVTQMFTFAIARSTAPANVIAGWGLGMLLRFVVLVGWGLVAPRAFGLPLLPAMVALASCFFVTSVVEPIFLKA